MSILFVKITMWCEEVETKERIFVTQKLVGSLAFALIPIAFAFTLASLSNQR
jgi:hypothetical protein